ncbi:hypothetical protein SAMN02799625_04542 [Methylobacterium sp. UNC300MFChir4.1]|uniref:hypothetical protein n=1 Tax=Methylobacterium sp. UNC300MFChir4.1 TaxID=1502747 RepID=UPI0008AD2DDE|nr:hypothetical protein [Methylobacterium sp. UNC300MFChir4.1]SEP04849.1 hypothetical protein SAMN02799625_04542 [Methylobacterium sp. UNC300MFChir4.1]
MAKNDYPTTKVIPAFRRPDGSFRPTWEYRGVQIDGLGLKGFVIAIRGRPTCVTLGEARDRIDAYHRRRAGQARRRVLAFLETPVRPGVLDEIQSPDYADLMECMAEDCATAA